MGKGCGSEAVGHRSASSYNSVATDPTSAAAAAAAATSLKSAVEADRS